MILKKGQMVLFTSGSYSDYSVHILVRCRYQCDTKKLIKEYLDTRPEQKVDYGFKVDQYIAWLTCEDAPFVEIEHQEYHMADNGCHRRCL
jgi:hypothetical protein